ncbi:MAG: hypothetical protein ACI9OD_002479 [Limisphaerales bacterium]|jgi:hypothetical protein
MNPRAIKIALALLLAAVSAGVFAQRFRGPDISNVRTAREADRYDNPNWTNNPAFKKDVFTFARLKYGAWGPGDSRGGRRWSTDFPDADLNLSFRLQQMTSMKVDPDGVVVEILDPKLFNYPWIYMVEPGSLYFTEEESKTLSKYFLNGGFMMVDDFWGEAEWENFYDEIKKVFPDREPIELEMDHPIFHTVFDIRLPKSQMQVPNVHTGTQSQWTGITHERDGRDVHFKGIFDDKGRMMVFIAHNTDNGDGWEREGDNEFYFREFSEKKAYPLGVNVIFYAMTH